MHDTILTLLSLHLAHKGGKSFLKENMRFGLIFGNTKKKMGGRLGATFENRKVSFFLNTLALASALKSCIIFHLLLFYFFGHKIG